MKQIKVSINIVTWNSLTYLQSCLHSVYKQTYKDFSVLVIDNGSTDGSIEFIQNNFPQTKILKNTQNLGYSRAHNQGLTLIKSDFALIMNPDIILTDDYLEKLIKASERHPEGASFVGKILKFHMKSNDLKEIEFTDKLDTIGIKAHRNRSFTNIGENETDSGQYETEKEIFGVSGGLLFLRKSELEKVRILNEYFDEDFFVYKEDVDLAWRMNLFGLHSFYIPEAKAYHHRQVSAPGQKDFKSISESRKLRSGLINSYSFRNHLFMLIKNETLSNLIWWLPYIFAYELKKFFYFLIFETKTLKSYVSFIKHFKKMLKKRKLIQKNIKINIKTIRKLFK